MYFAHSPSTSTFLVVVDPEGLSRACQHWQFRQSGPCSQGHPLPNLSWVVCWGRLPWQRLVSLLLFPVIVLGWCELLLSVCQAAHFPLSRSLLSTVKHVGTVCPHRFGPVEQRTSSALYSTGLQLSCALLEAMSLLLFSHVATSFPCIVDLGEHRRACRFIWPHHFCRGTRLLMQLSVRRVLGWVGELPPFSRDAIWWV